MAGCLLLTRRDTKGAPLLFFQAIAFRLNRNTMFQSPARMFNERLDCLGAKITIRRSIRKLPVLPKKN